MVTTDLTLLPTTFSQDTPTAAAHQVMKENGFPTFAVTLCTPTSAAPTFPSHTCGPPLNTYNNTGWDGAIQWGMEPYSG